MSTNDDRLLFVYNADSGRLNTWLDIGHKLLRPDSYACDLCQITHGVFRERAAWRAYRARSTMPLEFLHRDEFARRFPGFRVALPIVLRARDDGGLQTVLSREQIAALADVDALIARLPTA